MGLQDAESVKPDLQFYTTLYCPFAQRVWIAFLEKGVPFEMKEVNPYEKSPEFLAINPRGLVPVMVHHGKCIYESNVCLEYIEEVFSGNNSLLPQDPFERAYVRMWGDYVGKKIVSLSYRLLQLPEKRQETETELLKNFAELSAAMSDEGPYFMGKDFGMADIMLVPFTLRLYILKHYRGFEIPETQEYEKLLRWMKVCHAHPNVVPTMPDREKLLQAHGKYVEKKFTEEEVAKKAEHF